LDRILNHSLSEVSWKQATLPVSLGGLGLRKCSSISASAIVGARLDVHDLLNNLISSASDPEFVIPGGCETFDRLSSQCNGSIGNNLSNHTQRSLTVLVHSQEATLWKNLLSTSTVGNSARDLLRSQLVSRPHSGAWLQAYPSKVLRLGMQSDVFVNAVLFWLGVNYIPVDSNCAACKQLDQFGSLALNCGSHNLFLRRHNLVCNTLASIGYSARLSIGREHSFQGVKSADVLFRDFDFGRRRDLAVDVTIRNPFRMANGGLGVADAAEAQKVSKHGRSCEQLNVGFVGFGMDTFGGWGRSASTLLGRLATAIAYNDRIPRSVVISNCRRAVSVSLFIGIGESLANFKFVENSSSSCVDSNPCRIAGGFCGVQLGHMD
jgi:hypothetical protein